MSQTNLSHDRLIHSTIDLNLVHGSLLSIKSGSMATEVKSQSKKEAAS